MALEFEVKAQFSVPPERIYRAWLDSGQHTAMTGGKAQVSSEPGADFSAWDGYISGKNLELEAGRRILQSWRTSEFSDQEADSWLEILFEEQDGGTLVVIRHSNLPPHGEQYRQGWVDSYFTPMQDYFKS